MMYTWDNGLKIEKHQDIHGMNYFQKIITQPYVMSAINKGFVRKLMINGYAKNARLIW